MELDRRMFNELFRAALKSEDEEAYIDERHGATCPDELSRIWRAAHMSVREMIAAAGITQAAFCERYMIPLRSVQDWVGGRRNCPAYVRLMMARGLFEGDVMAGLDWIRTKYESK